MTARVTLAMVVAAFAAVAVCCVDSDERKDSSKSETRITEPQDAIGERLMIPLGQAKNFHRKAKVYMADGKLDEAIAAVRQILTIEFPAGAPEGEDVKLDAHALLAKLQLAKGDVDGAMQTVDAGIASATRDSFFLGNLHTVKGEVFEAIAAGLDAKSEEGRAARRSAIQSYDTSNQIYERVQKRLAGETE